MTKANKIEAAYPNAYRWLQVATDWAVVARMAYEDARGKSGGMKTAAAAGRAASEHHAALKAVSKAREALDDMDSRDITEWAPMVLGCVDSIREAAEDAYKAAGAAWLAAAGATGYAEYHSAAIYARGLKARDGQSFQPRYSQQMAVNEHIARVTPAAR